MEKVQDAMSKQQLKEQQHKEKTQSLLEKAEAYRVRMLWSFAFISSPENSMHFVICFHIRNSLIRCLIIRKLDNLYP